MLRNKRLALLIFVSLIGPPASRAATTPAAPETFECGVYEIVGQLTQNRKQGEKPGFITVYPKTTRHYDLQIRTGSWMLMNRYDHVIARYQVRIVAPGNFLKAAAVLEKAGAPMPLEESLGLQAVTLLHAEKCEK